MNADLTIFMWGYYGWGNWTGKLIEAVDALETSRGYDPPVFVDIRLRRSGRAAGFIGAAFEETLAPGRYWWMNGLGNLSIAENTGQAVKIKDPAQSRQLLELALDMAERNRRVIYYCSCQFPRLEGQPDACHRTTVARLLQEAARNLGSSVRILEWPGGEAETIEVPVTHDDYRKAVAGRKSISADGFPLSVAAGITYGSIVRLASPQEKNRYVAAVGPCQYRKEGWYFPILSAIREVEDETSLASEMRNGRRQMGYEVYYS